MVACQSQSWNGRGEKEDKLKSDFVKKDIKKVPSQNQENKKWRKYYFIHTHNKKLWKLFYVLFLFNVYGKTELLTSNVKHLNR